MNKIIVKYINWMTILINNTILLFYYLILLSQMFQMFIIRLIKSQLPHSPKRITKFIAMSKQQAEYPSTPDWDIREETEKRRD